jgi:hypothetical protein
MRTSLEAWRETLLARLSLLDLGDWRALLAERSVEPDVWRLIVER